MPRLESGMARIRVKDLRLRTYIGIKEEEINNKQDVLINLTMLYPAADAVRDNVIDHALNYRTITKAIIRHVEIRGRRLLRSDHWLLRLDHRLFRPGHRLFRPDRRLLRPE